MNGGRQCCLEETPTVKRLKIKGLSSRKVFIQPSTVIPSMLNSTGHKEGMTLEESTGSYQAVLKRGKFVGKIHSLMQEFHFASESLRMKLLNTYTTSFYGSPLWDPLSGECDRIYRCWNVAVRKLFGVDRKTHRFLIEPLSESIHPKVILLSRMVGFYKAQIESPKFCVRFLVRLSEGDKRTVLGKTLDHLRTACGLAHDETMKLTPSLIKRSLKYMELPEDEKWRVPLLKE